MRCGTVLVGVVGLWLATTAVAEDWGSVALVPHAEYQAVDSTGGTTYTGGFPVRLRGIVLNDAADWLDPTPAYDPDVNLWEMGGEWEIFVQAWDDPNETYDDGDFGGTSCWLGQNYGNHIMHQDPSFNYTDEEWLAEWTRVNYPDGVEAPPLAPGDLIEVRARAGLFYNGKMNVNEQHNIDPAFDFDIVRLQIGFGLPAAPELTLADLKDPNDTPIFDQTRQTGGERYQSTRLTLQDVALETPADWNRDTDVVIVDGTGRSLILHIGRNESFDRVFIPTGTFAVTGVLNQEAEGYPPDSRTGYYLIAMTASDFDPPLQVCGDVNCSGATDFFDIDPFVEALTLDEAGWQAKYPDCPWLNADLSGDGTVNFFDIDPFVVTLSTGACPRLSGMGA